MAAGHFQWLQMRIAEEKDRREREAMILERLPRAADLLADGLAECLAAYNSAFGEQAAEMERKASRMQVILREEAAGGWRESARIEIVSLPSIPGFQIDRSGAPMVVEVGMLPGDRLFYRDREKDQYLTMDELTRRILDRSMFPKLGE